MTLPIQTLVERIGDELKKQHFQLVTAESCTGGGLSYFLTSIPGSSEWFERGYVTYSDASKTELLGVRNETLLTYGAVSEETVREMAEGGLRNSPADWCIAITGIAGPSGGTSQKPVGTVWMAWTSHQFFTQAEVMIFPGDREQIRLGVIQYVLMRFLDFLEA